VIRTALDDDRGQLTLHAVPTAAGTDAQLEAVVVLPPAVAAPGRASQAPEGTGLLPAAQERAEALATAAPAVGDKGAPQQGPVADLPAEAESPAAETTAPNDLTAGRSSAGTFAFSFVTDAAPSAALLGANLTVSLGAAPQAGSAAGAAGQGYWGRATQWLADQLFGNLGLSSADPVVRGLDRPASLPLGLPATCAPGAGGDEAANGDLAEGQPDWLGLSPWSGRSAGPDEGDPLTPAEEGPAVPSLAVLDGYFTLVGGGEEADSE
jgi:hypothetical protein